MAGKEYNIDFKLAAQLEGSYNSVISKVDTDFDKLEKKIKEIQNLRIGGDVVNGIKGDLTNLVTKLNEVDAKRIGENTFKPMKDDIKDVRNHLNQLSSFRISADITSAVDVSLDALEKKLRLLGKFRIGKKIFEPMIQGADKVQEEIKKIQAMRITGDIVAKIREDLRKLENEFKEIKRMTGPVNVFANMIAEVKALIPDLREVKKLLTDISRIQQPNNRFNDDIDQYIRKLKELEAEMRRIQNQGGPSGGGGGGGGGGADDGGGGGGFIAAGGAGLLGATAVVGSGYLAFKYADEYQKAMLQIQASTNSTSKDMESMKLVAKNLYNQKLGEDWADLSIVIGRVNQVTGLTGKALEDTAKGAIVLRDTFPGLEEEQSIKAVDTMMRNFGITSNQAYNLLAQGAQRGLDKSGELLDTANEYAPYFAKLGFSAEGMFDVFAGGLQAGSFNLDKVGDGIKEFGIRTKDGSKASLAAYKSIGLNGAKMTAAFAKGGKTAQEAFLQTAKAISELKDPVLANAVSVQLYGTQAEDLEARVIKSYANIKHTFDQTKNSIDEIAKIKYSSMGDAFKGIGRQILTSVIIPVSNLLLPAFNNLSNWFNKSGPGIEKFFSKIGSGLDVVGRLAKKTGQLFQNAWNDTGYFSAAVGITNIGKEMGLSEDNAYKLSNGISDVVDKLAMLKPYVQIIKGLGNVAINTAQGTGDISGTQDINKGLEGVGFSPEQAIAISNNAVAVFDKVRGKVEEFVGTLKPAFDDIKAYFSESFTLGGSIDFGSILNDIKGLRAAIMPVIKSIADGFGPALKSVTSLLKPLMNVGKQAFTSLIPMLLSLASAVATKVGPVFTSVFGYITQNLLPQVSGVIQEWLPKIMPVVTGLVGLFKAILIPALGLLVKTFQGVWPLISAAVSGAIGIIKPIVSGLLTTLSGIIDFLTGVFTGNWQLAWDGFTNIVKGTVGSWTTVVKAAINAVIGIANGLIAGINSIKIDIPEWAPGGAKSFGISIPPIPTFADGGFSNQPSIFGEAGPEAAIPLNNKPRSMDLLDKTNRMMGYKPDNGGTMQVNYNPTIIVQGNADEKVLTQVADNSEKTFERMMNRVQANRRRVGMG